MRERLSGFVPRLRGPGKAFVTLALPAWFEIGSLIVLIGILALDLVVAYKHARVPSARECAVWVAIYVTAALAFALAILLIGDAEHAGEFVAGWLTEYSLSIDNLFVFVLIMARFAVPAASQQRVLMVGILIALVLRAVFIVLGAQLIANFSWVFYLFGAFLFFTAVQQVRGSGGEQPSGDNALTRFARRHLRLSSEFDGARMRTSVDGRRAFTPMVLVILALGSADLLFALDSIPAIYGITESPFIVFAANLFALMGLRQLYFLLGHLLNRLAYLKYAIAAILAFIGVKLVLHAMHENELPFVNGGQPLTWAPQIGTMTSLVVIIAVMTVAVVASVIRLRRDAVGSGKVQDAA